MENSSPIILEIMSDEEIGFGDIRKGDRCGEGGFGDREDHNWLSEILGEVDRNKNDDSDEVEIVSEVFADSKKSKFESRKDSAKIVDDEGDDCVVLDGDPEKPLVAVGSGRADDDDSDDLEIIGEKGEVACRDFPHPRHLCAKHPFASTSHDLHCTQCHCYVCDSLAPCASWGTGFSGMDHCHATDKEERWKAERKHIKKLNNPRLVLPRTIDTYFSAQLHQTTQTPQLAPIPPNSFVQNQGLRPINSRPCSISSNMPNVINQGRSLPSGYVVPRCKRQPQLAPQQLHTTCHSNIPSRGKTGNSGPQFISPRAVFKRSGSIGVSPNYDKNYYGSLLSRDPSLRRCHSFPNPVSNCHYSSNKQNTLTQSAKTVSQPISSFSQSINVRNVNYSHSQPQMTPQPCLSGNYVSMIPFQSHISALPNLENFGNMTLSQPDIVFQPNNPISTHQSTSNTFEDQSSQFEEFGNSTSLLIDGQHNFQQRSQSQSSVDTNATDFSYDWHASQLQSVVSTDTSQFQSMTEDAYRQSIAAADIDNTSHLKDIDCHIPGSTDPDSLDFDSDSMTTFEDEDVYLPEARDILWAAGKNPDLFL
ncbi:hypothetical protein BUALT_Bualt13G0025800 [Buddleja alternifolia]|uniref:Uncharacterized protein n=1 Tax=Buddleja alternifolia TaxID=168488 RepID=A0AAV6WRX8_9LAMI|nr:hypothetical protein BUALT_Bualt13G0025800 [Buddleja alternifolia]